MCSYCWVPLALVVRLLTLHSNVNYNKETDTIIAAFPIQAYLFARLISLFAFYGDYLRDETQFWCIMTVVLAVGVGICYFILSWACNTVSFVSQTKILLNGCFAKNILEHSLSVSLRILP
jgi:hypothetical protein